MLKNSNAAATIAVRDIAKAAPFYEGVLGLKRLPAEESGVLVYESGGSKVIVYPSTFAGTNRATSATWEVDSIESAVQELKDKGVSFEHYDLPGVTRSGDIHETGRSRAAWFKDPDGNILALVGS
jgi:catechol 2,3-dioxygenase-like lactoylglutathione lyase family enzyme